MRRSPSGWATVPAPPEPVETPPEEDILETTVTGSDGPIPGVEPPGPDDQLPMLTVHSRTGTRRWWVGAHHGAGASTLARLDDPEGPDALHGWPINRDGQEIVVVARETAQGITAARALARHYASGEIPGVRILALVTVPAFKGRLPVELAQELKLAASLFPRHYQAEWHPDYMFHNDPLNARANRANQKILRTIHRIPKG